MAKAKEKPRKVKYLKELGLSSEAARRNYAKAKAVPFDLPKSRAKLDPKVLKQFKDAVKASKAPMAKRVAKKSLAKKVISKLGVPGKVAVGAWTALEIAKGVKDVRSKAKAKAGKKRDIAKRYKQATVDPATQRYLAVKAGKKRNQPTSKAKGKSCKTGQYLNKKGVCISRTQIKVPKPKK